MSVASVLVVNEYEPLNLSLYNGLKWERSFSNKSPKAIKDGFR